MDKRSKDIIFSHINLNHTRIANIQHSNDFITMDVSIGSLNEPYYNLENLITGFQIELQIIAAKERPRAAVVVRKSTIRAFPIVTERDLVIIEVLGTHRRFCFASVYIPPTEDLSPMLDKLQYYIYKYSDYGFIINGDFNAKSTLWGNSNDQRGNQLLDLIFLLDLDTVNDPNSPATFQSTTGQSWIDLTLTANNIELKNWRVSDQETLSDHRLILMELGDEVYQGPKKINYHDLDLFKFSCRISSEREKWMRQLEKIDSTAELDIMIEEITNKIVSICETCKKRKEKSYKGSPKWWSLDLAIHRKRLRAEMPTASDTPK
ncbi:uncharacterized protein [Parasteatoda tepidariorum]|uniref:uncharacterized protein n=1 Tax=Parasteatoda tepidariorum TaxID=114398 RepID=UPI0039BCE0FF